MEQDGWQLEPTDVTICKTPSGQDILIGQGGFGAVRLLCSSAFHANQDLSLAKMHVQIAMLFALREVPHLYQ